MLVFGGVDCFLYITPPKTNILNLKMPPWKKEKHLNQTSIFGFHVNFRGCIVHDFLDINIKLCNKLFYSNYMLTLHIIYYILYTLEIVEDDTLRIQHVFPSFWPSPNKNLRPSLFSTPGPKKFHTSPCLLKLQKELRTAAKASKDATTCFTEKRSFCTWLLSAPPASSPHVTTVPSIRTAVKAVSAPITWTKL